MFDIAFSELVVIAIVALIVVGPERLPKVARTLGVIIGRFQKMAQHFKDDLTKEIPLQEVHQIKADLENQSQQITEKITAQTRQTVAEIQETLDNLPPDFYGPPQKK